MNKEKITQRDFIIRAMPELSSEGIIRDTYMDLKDFSAEIEEDKAILRFKLGKGSYATVFIHTVLGYS